jgi:hypothetical protein
VENGEMSTGRRKGERKRGKQRGGEKDLMASPVLNFSVA